MSANTNPKDGSSEEIINSLIEKDSALINELASAAPLENMQQPFRNSSVASLASAADNIEKLKELKTLLREKGTFDLNIERRKWTDTDKEEKEVVILRAASTDMWPMGTHYWTRDNALIGARLLFYPDNLNSSSADYKKLGKELLLSSLTLMSSVSQLKRFRAIIQSTSKRFINNAANWPHIFFGIDDNLNAAQNVGWSHKQDAWQILAFYILEALQRNLISISELSLKNKEMLGLLLPFLSKIAFHQQENSGSWEEIPAVRSSVLCWEILLIDKIRQLSKVRSYNFINSYLRLYKLNLKPAHRKLDFDTLCSNLLQDGAKTIAKMLPFECPQYAKSDARYREGDAALIYLLQTELSELLTKLLGKEPEWAKETEEQILMEVLKLKDMRSGGIRRYLNDSYQRQGFFRHLTVYKLNLLYGNPSGDASSHFRGRDEIVEKGREAAWAHFVWQLSAWAGRKYMQTKDEKYSGLQKEMFVDGLRMITGEGDRSLHQKSDTEIDVIEIPAFRIPECIITDKKSDGQEILFPTPHTPLNWAIAEAIDAFAVLEQRLAIFESNFNS